MKISAFITAISAAALSAVLSACAGETTKEEALRRDFEGSIENPANNAGISDVIVRRVAEDSTRSIFEVLTGEEFRHGRLFIRTDERDRSGLYFFVMFKTYTKDILEGSQIDLYVHSSKSPKVEKFSFKVPENFTLLREVALGITGADAPKVDDKILAWKIEVRNKKGEIISQKQSWLWSVENPSPAEK